MMLLTCGKSFPKIIPIKGNYSSWRLLQSGAYHSKGSCWEKPPQEHNAINSSKESVNWGMPCKSPKHWSMPFQYHIMTSCFQRLLPKQLVWKDPTDWGKLEGWVLSTLSSISKYTLLNISNRKFKASIGNHSSRSYREKSYLQKHFSISTISLPFTGALTFNHYMKHNYSSTIRIQSSHKS